MKKNFHVVDPATSEWYHIDERRRLWTCDCRDENDVHVSLCLTLDDSLVKEGEIRELDRQIAMKRKMLGLKIGEPMPDEK